MRASIRFSCSFRASQITNKYQAMSTKLALQHCARLDKEFGPTAPISIAGAGMHISSPAPANSGAIGAAGDQGGDSTLSSTQGEDLGGCRRFSLVAYERPEESRSPASLVDGALDLAARTPRWLSSVAHALFALFCRCLGQRARAEWQQQRYEEEAADLLAESEERREEMHRWRDLRRTTFMRALLHVASPQKPPLVGVVRPAESSVPAECSGSCSTHVSASLRVPLLRPDGSRGALGGRS